MTKKAFIIGANTAGLRYAENDGYLMRACLEIHGFSVVHPIPDRLLIEKNFNAWVDSWEPTDTVIFYFSGHGMAPEVKGQLHLVVGHDPGSEQCRLDFAMICRAFERHAAAGKLIILDCCRSGASEKEWTPQDSKAYRLLTAGRMLEKTEEVDEFQAGFLTFKFYEALTRQCGQLADPDGVISISRVYRYMTDQWQDFHETHPESNIPKPCLFGNEGDDFPLAGPDLAREKLDTAIELFDTHFPEDPAITPMTGWPYPIQKAIDHMGDAVRAEDMLNLFEALVHFHFIAIGSRFFWSLDKEQLANPGPDIEPGLHAVFQTLRDPACCGAPSWVLRSGLVSKSMTAVQAPDDPFQDLVAIFQPETLEIEPVSHDPDQMPAPAGSLPWRIGQAGPMWQCLQALSDVRACLVPGMGKLDGTARIVLWLIHWFRAYRDLGLAMVSVVRSGSDRYTGIHCLWDHDTCYCVNSPVHKPQIQQIWNRMPQTDVTAPAAPDPPRPDLDWKDSLILYDPDRPYERSVYLMPLGFRFVQHGFGHTLGESVRIPGLLDSVRWKPEKKVDAVFQRPYEIGLLEPGWQVWQGRDRAVRDMTGLNKAIEYICQSLKFDMPKEPQRITEPAPVFDLRHDLAARRQAEHMVIRTREMERIETALWNSEDQCLLLEGPSGSGKTVLMSQLFLRHEQTAVFLSVENLPEFDLSTIHRPGMYCLDTLCRINNMARPRDGLDAGQIAGKIRDHLGHLAVIRPRARFLIIVDGLNQAPDPAGLMEFLPVPFPENLRVIAASQPLSLVRESLVLYGTRPWPATKITDLDEAEIREIGLGIWTRESMRAPALPASAFPEFLLEDLHKTTGGLVVLLAHWVHYLKRLYGKDPEGFTEKLRANPHAYRPDQLPQLWWHRLKEMKKGFTPARLMDAVILCFRLIPRALTLTETYEAVMEVKHLDMFPDLPAVAEADVENLLRHSPFAAGFLRRETNKDMAACRTLYHETLGNPFLDTWKNSDILPRLRLALSRFGAIVLPPDAPDAEFRQWVEWVETDHEKFYSLYPDTQAGICLALMDHFPKHSREYWIGLTGEVGVRLLRTGEALLAFRRQKELETGLAQEGLDRDIRAKILESLGDIHKAQNRLDEAMACYKESLAIRRALVADAPTAAAKRELTYALNRVGDIHEAQNRLDEAMACYKEDLAISRDLVADAPTAGAKQDLTYALNRVGDIHEAQNRLDEAMACFEESLAISRDLVADAPTAGAKRELAVTLNRVGDIHEAQNRLDEAMACYKESLAIRRDLVADAPTAGAKRDLAFALNRVGDIHQVQNRPDEAMACFEESLAISRALVADAPTAGAKQDLTYALNRVGDIHKAENRPDEAMACFEESLAIRRELFKASDIPQTRKDLKFAENQMMSFLRSTKTGIFAAKADAWPETLWADFITRVWNHLTDAEKQDLLDTFPQTPEVRAALSGNRPGSRPTLGLTIAASRLSGLILLVKLYVDFDWWQASATPDQLAAEQLENLDADTHGWGVIRHDPPFLLALGQNDAITPDMARELQWGLTMFLSLSVEEKQKVIDKYPDLSPNQVEELLHIFREERFKFAVFGPDFQEEIIQMVHTIWKDQEVLKEEEE